ncbi:MAG: hypothetical protein LBV74_02465 [Tannerella sp.]|jgi:hypothetical protein|nr:hypothetical protein [Tannerella sp.]
MEIKRGNKVIADVVVSKSSYTLEEISGVHTAYIEFDILNPIELTINDYIEYRNNTYYIRYKESISKEETSLGYNYKITLYHELYRMHDTILFMYDEPDFNKNHNYFRGTVSGVLDLIVKSMNRNGDGWTKGIVIESETTTFDLKDKTCAEVLQNIINDFNTEYWVEGKTINIGKREHNSNGIVLSQRNGFKNLTLSAVDDTPPITRLYVYGSDTNLTKNYGKSDPESIEENGSDYLLLPDGKKYIEKNVDKYGVIEHIKQFDDIYPYGVFRVTEKIDNFTLCASGIDFDLKDQFIQDVEAIVTFQGNSQLAGYDLAIAEGSWDNGRKMFKLVKNKEENALEVPGSINFNPGDEFILTGIKMPDPYIKAAEQRLLEAAQKWLDEKCENRVQLQATCDEIYFYENDISLSCGQMIGVYDTKLNLDREIRITNCKLYIENGDDKPYRYEITISDFLQSSGLSQVINDIKQIPNQIDRESSKNKQYTKRQFRDALELGNALQGAFKNFSEGIDPVYVRTMQLLVGDNSHQYRFVNSKTDPITEVDHEFNIDDETKIFTARSKYFPDGHGIIQHMTLGIDTLAPSHSTQEYKDNFWDIAAYSRVVPDTDAYWLYMRCSKTNGTGEFLLTKTPIEMEGTAGYYHFVVGYLNSEYEGSRSFVTLYGYTEILPGQMRTNKIMSTDGTQYWDMLSKKFKIGDANSHVSWNVDKQNQLVIKGTILQSGTTIQSPDGDTIDYIGIDRGNWLQGTTYYPGDMVKYNGNVYKCVKQNSIVRPDTSDAYWKLMISKGADGANGSNGKDGTNGANGTNGVDGQGYLYAYYADNSPTYAGRPSTPGVIPSDWMASPNFNGKKYIYVSQCIKTAGVWEAWTTATAYAVYPEKGDVGPVYTFLGSWADIPLPHVFYNNSIRRDGVMFYLDDKTNKYWIYKGTDGASITKDIGFRPYTDWEPFGAEFKSVATDLLYTPNGNVGGWLFQNEKMVSQSGKSWMNGRTGEFNLGDGNFTVDESGNIVIKGRYETSNGDRRITINPAGSLKMYDGNFVVLEINYENDPGTNTTRVPFITSRFFNKNTGHIVVQSDIVPGAIRLLDANGNGTLLSSSLLRINLDSFPNAASQVSAGCLYRDGNTIKVKLS